MESAVLHNDSWLIGAAPLISCIPVSHSSSHRPCMRCSADVARRLVSPGQGEDAHNRRGAGVRAGAGQAAARRDQRGQVHPLRDEKPRSAWARRDSGATAVGRSQSRRRIGRHQRQAVGRRQPRLPAAAQPLRPRSQPRLLAAAGRASWWRASVTRAPIQPEATEAILHWKLQSRPCRAAVHLPSPALPTLKCAVSWWWV